MYVRRNGPAAVQIILSNRAPCRRRRKAKPEQAAARWRLNCVYAALEMPPCVSGGSLAERRKRASMAGVLYAIEAAAAWRVRNIIA